MSSSLFSLLRSRRLFSSCRRCPKLQHVVTALIKPAQLVHTRFLLSPSIFGRFIRLKLLAGKWNVFKITRTASFASPLVSKLEEKCNKCFKRTSMFHFRRRTRRQINSMNTFFNICARSLSIIVSTFSNFGTELKTLLNQLRLSHTVRKPN